MRGYTRRSFRSGSAPRARWRILTATIATALAAGVGLAGCAARPDPDAVIRVGVAEPTTLLPTAATSPADAQILAALFTPLVGFDDAGRPFPWAAESIVPSPDNRVWTIRLREGYTFHNGEPVTSDRYLAAWNYTAYRPNQQPNNYYFAPIAGYEALNPPEGTKPTATTLAGLAKIDDRTFTVTLREPSGEFPAMLAAPAFYPLPSAAFHADGRLVANFATAPIGNGPFQLWGSWQRGQSVEVTRYDRYPGERPRVGGVTFVGYREAEQAYADLRAGKVDLITTLPEEQVDPAMADLGDRILRPLSGRVQFLAFPSHEKQWRDARLRQAVSMAIDRDALVNHLFPETGVPARSFVPPVVPGARPDTCGQACQFNPDAAYELYQEAGGPATLTISYNTDRDHQRGMTEVCAQLAANLGVKCTARPAGQFTELVSEVTDQKPVGLLRMGWSQEYPSMAAYLGPLFTSTGSANLAGYQNPEVDTLVGSGIAALSEAEALAAYQLAEAAVAADLPVIPLWFERHALAHSPRLRWVTVTGAGVVDLRRLEVIE
ncbi:MAG TPA: ABC transporter substrate-binding protein [Natronosporangium sp.]|nr:ABC transporter substrate-binding protein [Natronosporangium sp.]